MRSVALLLLPSLLELLAHGLSSEAPTMGEGQAPGMEETDGELTVAPTPEQPERGVHFVTTAPTLKLLNHHPLLEEFLQEGLEGSEEGLRPALPFQPDPPTPLTPSPLPRLANQDSRPVFTSPTPAMVAAPTQPQSRERPWSLESEPRVLRSTAPLPPVPTLGPGERPSTTLPSRAWTPTQEGPGDMGRPWAPEVKSQIMGLGMEGTITTSTASGDDEETTTTIITTTITTVQPPGPCSWNFSGPEGSLDSPVAPSSPTDVGLDCFYYISVYPGYGVEIRVQNISLREGETVTVEGLGGPDPLPLANQSFLLRGQVIRSPTHQAALRFQSLPPPAGPGTFHFHYQAYLLNCHFPRRPAYGTVTVTSLHPGGSAHFYCATGYQLKGARLLTCLNATQPFWDSQEPVCIAACGGVTRNATTGRIVSPGFPGNYSNNLTCHWLLEAPEGQRLHLHFEKVSLAEDDDRLIIRNGDNVEAPPVYDSYEVEYLPIEGLLSSGRHFFVELSTDSSGAAAGMALRYEAFQQGHCYEPFVKYGNFSSSAPSYPVGSTVEFSCDPGYTLEQGSIIIECIDPHDPQWNETEPACRAVCSGEITDSAGVVLSPNWPEPYSRGQDCIWGVHVEEDKRIMLDIRVLRIGPGDVLTFYDGDDLTARVLGQYSGPRGHFKLFTSMADVTIQFQSDPGALVLGYQQGFVIHFFVTSCHDPGDVEHSRRLISSPKFPVGATVQYICDQGFVLTGSAILTCHDRQASSPKWSDRAPKCLLEQLKPCHGLSAPENGAHSPEKRLHPAGATVHFSCAPGYVLKGQASIKCVPGHPSHWSDPPPICRAASLDGFYSGRSLDVAKAPAASSTLDVAHVAAAIFLPLVVMALLVGGVYLYFSRLQGKSPLRLPRTRPRPYDRITVESEFDNPTYEIGSLYFAGDERI
ncbi:seizure protein 6 homolog isoform X6 [Canis lupus dingo]|uniref:seizure protein 6 homolog isoform X6 n=1 Tax=Canis lupus dingo TaxID=286419 RepID=UPI000BAA18C3|nr:seizure protein 6 homolog isoform X6 [Canis lupus dingo]|eukprot:XP_022279061.1 seizure protein 6 homolog isoform X6 [Canis lupus familiaris]